MKLYIKKIFILFIPIVMLCSILSEYSFINAEAAANRTIKIEEVRGIVMIQKNGGLKLIRAYEGMILQQGDRISTNSYSSLRIIIQDTNDEITISENAEFFIANLDEANGNKRTKLTIWNGSIWAKVTPLVNSKDKFEIGTPSSKMNVRGTNLLVGIDPITGEAIFFIASGRGEVSGSGQGSSTLVLPSQQLTIDGSMPNNSGGSSIVDLDSLIRNMNPAIIAAMLRSKAAIDKENANYISSLQQGQQVNRETLDRLKGNLDNLVGNIAKQALQQNKIDKQTLNDLINKLKEQQDINLDLDNTPPLQLTEAEKDRLAQLKKLEEERRNKAEEEKRKQELLKQQQQILLNKLDEVRKKQLEEKVKALEEKQKKAQEALKRKLDEKAKLALEEKLRALELERKKQEEAASAQIKVPVPTPPSEPSGNPGPSISNVDKNLAKAKATIPASSEPYIPDTWERVLAALAMGEANNSEKVEKTEAIKSAMAGLVTIIDQNLMDAKSSIPTNPELYRQDTWERVLAALTMGEANNSEKVEKTEAIRNAIEELVEIPVTPEIVIVAQSVGPNYISLSWSHFINATKYEVYLNDVLVRDDYEIMEDYSFGKDELESGKSHTLEILALDENETILARKTIDFQTEAPIEDLVPTP